jgi:endo-1,4-beta-D-glucanase Y
MSFEIVLSAIDRSLAPEKSVQRSKRGLGRRRLLTLAAIGATVASTTYMVQTQMGRAAENQTIPPEKVRLPHLLPSPQGVDKTAWETFRRRFIHEDGRIIDTGNRGVSHTEGQGVGMLLAAAFDDRPTFERIWGWTAANLSRGSDALHAWRYVPGTANPVADTNTATDGDIYIAAALIRASVRWAVPDYLQAGQAIARDLLALSVMDVAGRTVLLPGAAGFVKRNHAVVNLSYYVFPLLTELQMAAPSPLWDRVITDGRKLVEEARFGARNLPPDWLQVSTRTGEISVADDWPPRFSFDAVRIPLFLAWAGSGDPQLARFSHFWGDRPARAAAWVDLGTDAVAPYNVSNGVVAIATLAMRTRRKTQAGFPAVTENDDYYSASLNVIARLAAFESDARTTAAMDT